MKRTPIVLTLCLAVLALPAAAWASDTSLVKTFVKQATQFGKDADKQNAVSSAPGSTAKQVWAATEVVRLDAVRAEKAVQAERPSTAKGKQIQTLAAKAFGLYAVAEKELELAITAATKHDKAGAAAHTAKSQNAVKQAAVVLNQAGKVADTL